MNSHFRQNNLETDCRKREFTPSRSACWTKAAGPSTRPAGWPSRPAGAIIPDPERCAARGADRRQQSRHRCALSPGITLSGSGLRRSDRNARFSPRCPERSASA